MMTIIDKKNDGKPVEGKLWTRYVKIRQNYTKQQVTEKPNNSSTVHLRNFSDSVPTLTIKCRIVLSF